MSHSSSALDGVQPISVIVRNGCPHGEPRMAWFPIALTDDEQRIVNAERESHPEAHVRRKMLVLWLLHCQVTRAKAAAIAGLGRATVQRYVAAYRDGGLEGLRHWDVTGPVSDLAAYTDAIKESLTEAPVRTVSEACDRIETLTGLRRGPTQVRRFLAGLGFPPPPGRAGPAPPQKNCPGTFPASGSARATNREPTRAGRA